MSQLNTNYSLEILWIPDQEDKIYTNNPILLGGKWWFYTYKNRAVIHIKKWKLNAQLCLGSFFANINCVILKFSTKFKANMISKCLENSYDSFSICKQHFEWDCIDNFGVSVAIAEIFVRGCKLDFEPGWLCESPGKSKNVRPSLCIVLHPDNML